MLTRYAMFGAAALAFAGIAAAEPVKPESAPSSQATNRPAVVLASADQVRTPAAIDQAQAESATPVKRRAARVTSCRCGGQTPSDQ